MSVCGGATIKIYILKRILMLVPLLICVTFTSFCLLKVLPGDPVFSMVGERATPETIENIRKEIGVDRDFLSQYLGYLELLGHGNFGRSYYSNRDVMEDIAAKLPNTMTLAVAVMAIAVPFGLVAGMIMAYRRDGFVERVVNMFTIGGVSLPVFWIGLIIMLILSLKLRLLPPSGTGGFKFIVLPALTLSLPVISTLARVAAASIEESMGLQFARTARAKGLAPLKIAVVHVMRNALIPVVTIIGLEFGSYLNGAVVTETIFGWDGVGRFAMQGIIMRDYPVIMGCVITCTAVFVVVNMLTDIVYHYIDPRIRIQNGKW
ncbi:MAG TPA: ABC transporter permease [Dissulfurispiraceae bacterium]|nr:ABC transporter permease [Dissulfurispiraceae bacterium]